MNVLTVATLKGGNAKTTTCLALAAAFAEEGHSIAVVDADPQATATMIFGQRPVVEPWHAEPVELSLPDLRAGSITLIRGGRTLRLASAKQRAAFLERDDVNAELIIVDTAPGEIELVDAALGCSRVVVAPVEPSPLSLTGMNDVAGLVARHDPMPLLRTVLTRVHKVRLSAGELAERVERLLPGTLCQTRIPEDARVVDSPDFGLPVTLSDRRCRASVAYRELAEELSPLVFDGTRSVPAVVEAVTSSLGGGEHVR